MPRCDNELFDEIESDINRRAGSARDKQDPSPAAPGSSRAHEDVERWHIEEKKRWEDPDADPWWLDLGGMPSKLSIGPFDNRIEAVQAYQKLVEEGKVVRLVLVERRVVDQVHAVS
jgi:hypothetical protein